MAAQDQTGRRTAHSTRPRTGQLKCYNLSNVSPSQAPNRNVDLLRSERFALKSNVCRVLAVSQQTTFGDIYIVAYSP